MKKPAYFDSSTGKIMNCKKGTLLYYHEEGHKKWFNEGKERIMETIAKDVISVFLPLIVLYLSGSLFLTLIASIPLISSLTSEAHAWGYGIIKWIKNRK